tara:strand:+ start:377 stop:1258 length:882 start_codon:yes stop_codon:yes gene_type:complete
MGVVLAVPAIVSAAEAAAVVTEAGVVAAEAAAATTVVAEVAAVEAVAATTTEVAILATEATTTVTELTAVETAAGTIAAETETVLATTEATAAAVTDAEGVALVEAEEAIVQEGGVLSEGAIEAAAQEEGTILVGEESAVLTDETLVAEEAVGSRTPGLVTRVLRHPVVRVVGTALDIYTVGEMGYDIGACEENWTDDITGLHLQDINPKCRPPTVATTPSEIPENPKKAAPGPLARKAPVYNEDADELVVPMSRSQPTSHSSRVLRREVTYEYPIVPAAALLALAAVVSARA